MGFLSRLGKHADEHWFYGLSPRTLRKTPSLLPMFFFIGTGVAICIVFSTRTLLYNPDALDPFTKKGNWELYRNGKYFKIFNIAGVAPPCMAPDYKQPGDPDDNSYAVKYFGEDP